jgi:ubiquinone/menaquinone biosynthesis C-methylase UbiE
MAGEGLDLPADRFALFNGPRLPFPDGQFDAIIDRESLCQSGWAEIRERVAEFRRVLKPGGWYLGINFTDHHPDARHATCLGNGDWHEFRQGLFKGQGRRHLFSINDLSELFADWRIDHVLHHSVTAVLGSREEVSEYVIAAQTPGAPTP